MNHLSFRPALFSRQVNHQIIHYGKCYISITNDGIFAKAEPAGDIFRFPIDQSLITYLD